MAVFPVREMLAGLSFRKRQGDFNSGVEHQDVDRLENGGGKMEDSQGWISISM